MNAFKSNFAAVGVALLLGLLAYSQFVQPNPLDELRANQLAIVEAMRALHVEPQLRERVIELPEDAGAWYTTLVYDAPTPAQPASRQLAAMMATNPRLQSLTAQTKTIIYTPGDRMYQSRFRHYYSSATPQIIVQDPTGKVAFKASGEAIPADAELLADAIAAGIEQCCPRPRPRPDQPQPQPTPQPTPATIPDIGPTPTETPGGDLSPLLFLLPFLAGGAGAFSQLKKE